MSSHRGHGQRAWVPLLAAQLSQTRNAECDGQHIQAPSMDMLEHAAG